ncbi:hypothetical protein KQI91_03530 [Blautia sp. MSJ-19]|nr:hypothetical protein [Blautia sp. MSJ-19]
MKKNNENISRQASIVNALGKDYVNICLLNVETETVILVKAFDRTLEELGNHKNPEMPYYEMCERFIRDFATSLWDFEWLIPLLVLRSARRGFWKKH